MRYSRLGEKLNLSPQIRGEKRIIHCVEEKVKNANKHLSNCRFHGRELQHVF